jgi:hypothetical protein
LTPDINLDDAVTDGLFRMERARSFIHCARVIEQADVRQDSAQTVIGVRQIVLESDSAFEFGDGFEVLEILGRSPKQVRPGDVSLRQIRIKLQCALAMKVCFFQPSAGGVELEMAGRAHQGKNRMGQRKSGIARNGIDQVPG